MLAWPGAPKTKRTGVAFSSEDVDSLLELVRREHGDFALAHVSRYVDQLRRDGEQRSADLWSMVLAKLYQHVQLEKRVQSNTEVVKPTPIVLVKTD